MKRILITSLIALSFALPGHAAAKSPVFKAETLPTAEGLKTELQVSTLPTNLYGKGTCVWRIEATAVNQSPKPMKFKLVLSAEPGIPATHYLIPGVLYNGNEFVGKTILTDGRGFSLEMPGGWEKDGQPWIFAGDRSNIPACTISENKECCFALFASDGDMNSITGSSSLEKCPDGSFRHKIYWPMTEAPYSYCDKRKFSPRYDEFIYLAPGESYQVTAYACEGKPLWENYGFATAFSVAWKVLNHRTDAQKSVAQTIDLDLEALKWYRRRNDEGYWFAGDHNDKMFSMGYMNIDKSSDGYTLAQYEQDYTLDKWQNNAVEEHKLLSEGEYLEGAGSSGIGFASQSFQKARVSIQYGLQFRDRETVRFGIDVLRSWIAHRQRPCGLFGRNVSKGKHLTNTSELGWAIGELSRTAAFLRAHKSELEALGLTGTDAVADEFQASAAKVVGVVMRTLPGDGALGSTWDFETGELLSHAGDGGGYVLMGLVRYWKLTGDAAVRKAIDEAFTYYYKDIDRFECNGGAMDCASVDREGIQPFMSAAVEMWQATGKKTYLERARKAGWYFLSWVYLQNPVYAPDKDLSVYNWRPAGSTIVGTEHPALDDYGQLLIAELMALSKADKNELWREVAALMWRNGTQGFADNDRKIWHSLERPYGAKNEAWFQTRWSKYRTGENKRGSLNEHLTNWGGTYRLASLLELSAEDYNWLESVSQPCTQVVLENAYGRAGVDLRGAVLRFWQSSEHPGRQILGPEGVSLSWPWAAHKGHHAAGGLLPYYDWKVAALDGDSVLLTLDADETSLRVWPYNFSAQLRYTLSKTLKVEFSVQNTGDKSVFCTDFLQAFFLTSHPRNAYVNGKAAARNGLRYADSSAPFFLADKDRKMSVRFNEGLKVLAQVIPDGCVGICAGNYSPKDSYLLRPGESRTLQAEIEIAR